MRNGIVGSLAIALALAGCEAETETEVVTQAAGVDPVPLAETDLVHLGSLAAPITVTVAATGTNGRLTSWKVGTSAVAPSALQDSALISGANHQLHVLTPLASPKLERELLVSASVLAGTLSLRTWRVADDGTFTQLGFVTYGGVGVLDYALGHRQILGATKKFQLVAPLVRAGGNLRLVSWEIDGTSGVITLKADSGDLVNGVAGDAQLTVAAVTGTSKLRPHYAVSFLNALGQITNTLWSVDDKGVSTLRGNLSSGMNIGNFAPVIRSATSLASAPLTASGFVTVGDASMGQTGVTGEVQVWEDLADDSAIVPLDITDSSLDTLPATPGVQLAAPPALVIQRGAVLDAASGTALYTQNENYIQALASVRKVMVLLVTLDRLKVTGITLDDVVTVSNAAAGSSGSNMGLVAGEQMTLRDLLYGMMMASAGDATWAISEYVAGSVDNMIFFMNQKASDLGLGLTVYCHDKGDSGFSSVGYSTARDQAVLWAAAYNDPTFLDIAGKPNVTATGILADGTVRKHVLGKDMSQYLELDGWKGGNGGGSCAAYKDLYEGCSECLTAQTTRLRRALVSNVLRSSGGNTMWTDATRMFDQGYRQIFTPDWRGDSGVQAGATTDFGIDAVSDVYAMTATLPGGATLRVCNWAVDVGNSIVVKTPCTDRALAGLTAGGVPAAPRRLAVAPVPTVDSEADYVVGRVSAGALKLTGWRVGSKY